MKKQHQNDHPNDMFAPNKGDNAYFRNLETFLLGLFGRKPMSFQDIVCLAEGAYPTDVLHTLRKIVLSNKLEQHDDLYYLPGLKCESTERDTSHLANLPPLPGKQVTSRLLTAKLVFADPHQADYDWRYTSEARDELTKRLSPFIECESEIALFGAPTLFLSLSRLGVHVTLFDSSSSILADLKSSGFASGLFHHNLFDPLPDFGSKYEVIVADPPWYTPFHTAFVLRSSELLKEQGLLMLSVPPWLTRPSAITDRADIVAFTTKAGFSLSEIVPGALSYECPKFEQIDLSMQGIRCVSWRLGDLFIFRKVKEALSSLKVSYPKDEPKWDEYRFGLVKVKLRQRTSTTDSGELKIRPVSDEGPYLGTVSRRFPLRRRIDIWTSDNIAYSVNRIDVIKVALDRLQSGESPKTIATVLGKTARLSETAADTLLKLLSDITMPYEQDNFRQLKKPQFTVSKRGNQPLERISYLDKFIKDSVLPNIEDSFWQGRLSQLLIDETCPHAIHLAIFVEPYLQFILEGRKTVESRFNSRRCAPYQKVQVGDILLLKRSSGPVVGLCEVAGVWFYRLDPQSWETIRREFTQALCVQDPSFWENRKHASYATLMRIRHVCPITPVKFIKRDRRGWVLLTANSAQRQLEFKDR